MELMAYREAEFHNNVSPAEQIDWLVTSMKIKKRVCSGYTSVLVFMARVVAYFTLQYLTSKETKHTYIYSNFSLQYISYCLWILHINYKCAKF